MLSSRLLKFSLVLAVFSPPLSDAAELVPGNRFDLGNIVTAAPANDHHMDHWQMDGRGMTPPIMPTPVAPHYSFMGPGSGMGHAHTGGFAHPYGFMPRHAHFPQYRISGMGPHYGSGFGMMGMGAGFGAGAGFGVGAGLGMMGMGAGFGAGAGFGVGTGLGMMGMGMGAGLGMMGMGAGMGMGASMGLGMSPGGNMSYSHRYKYRYGYGTGAPWGSGMYASSGRWNHGPRPGGWGHHHHHGRCRWGECRRDEGRLRLDDDDDDDRPETPGGGENLGGVTVTIAGGGINGNGNGGGTTVVPPVAANPCEVLEAMDRVARVGYSNDFNENSVATLFNEIGWIADTVNGILGQREEGQRTCDGHFIVQNIFASDPKFLNDLKACYKDILADLFGDKGEIRPSDSCGFARRLSSLDPLKRQFISQTMNAVQQCRGQGRHGGLPDDDENAEEQARSGQEPRLGGVPGGPVLPHVPAWEQRERQ